MFVYASSEFVNNIPKTDFSKVSKLWEKDWSVKTIKSAVVKVVATIRIYMLYKMETLLSVFIKFKILYKGKRQTDVVHCLLFC